jgi:hypothetical protein
MLRRSSKSSLRGVTWALMLAGVLAACGQQAQPEQLVAVDPQAQSRDLRLLSTLKPGAFREIPQKLNVNVVFIGYGQGTGAREVDPGKFRAGLPQQYRTVNRIPSLYSEFAGGDKEFSGNRFNYQYNLKFARKNFEDRFFQYLSSIAVKKPLSLFQQLYNSQDARSLTIPTDGGYWIDAPKVEKWLAQNAWQLGVNTREYTTFFINWYGRSDFKFHVYTKTNEPDPDTGYNFGELRSSRKMIAWGGTTPNDEENGLGSLHRIWFHDLSAGPESNTGQYDITNADLDGDDELDYRMPPIWDYGNTKGYRPFDDLSGDLSKVMRYVAINLLFTASPLYRVQITPPTQPESLEIDVNMFEGDAVTRGLDFVQAKLLKDELSDLQPLNTFVTSLKSQPISQIEPEYRCYSEQPFSAPCAAVGGSISGAALFIYTLVNNLALPTPKAQYRLPALAFNIDQSFTAPFLGLADDDFLTGAQSQVYAVSSSAQKAAGYGFTTTLIHEVGHHLAMSHPHDGFDYEQNIDYGPGGDTFFAWAGDESNSMMSYIDLNWDFSQFDRDNMNRYLTSGYINNANTILGQFAKADLSKAPIEAFVAVFKADILAYSALGAYNVMEYATASSLAKKASEEMQKAAKLAKVDVDVFLWYEQFSSSSSEAAAKAKVDPSAVQRHVESVKRYASDSEYFERHRNLP